MAAILILSALFWMAGLRASIVVDGTRYHFLDDDQMISMRYARNLADGHGPVWNPGERVEGYTNFGWMLAMAGVHRLGAGDATAALWVRAINWGLACLVVLLSVQLLRVLGETSPMALAGLLLPLSVATDLLFWAINGFETTGLTALFLWALLRALDDARVGRFRASTCVLAGLLPLIRADALDLTAAVLTAAFALGARRQCWMAAFAALPLLASEGFRLWYYGDWLPNTYYLKVAGREGLFLAGLGHLKAFVSAYAVAVVLAAVALTSSAGRRLRVLAGLIGFGVVRVAVVGPDMFPGFRFLAPYVPVLLVVAAAAIARVTPAPLAARTAMTAALILATVLNAGVSGRSSATALVSANGGPYVNTVSGVLVNRHALPGSRIAVAAAGCMGYFARRDAVDLLGKSDRRIARLPPRGEATGHNRFDIDWSLRHRPDIVVSFGPHLLAAGPAHGLPPGAGIDYGTALVLNAAFVREYRNQTVPLRYLLDRNALFIHEGSPERNRLLAWREPVVSP